MTGSNLDVLDIRENPGLTQEYTTDVVNRLMAIRQLKCDPHFSASLLGTTLSMPEVISRFYCQFLFEFVLH